MALLQCKDYFADKPHIRLVEAPDTATAAKQIAEQGEKGVAAIASSAAASLYNLDILAHSIQTIQRNARFR